MATRKPPRNGRPGSTPENHEAKMISLAFDLAEKQLRDGSASSQTITHFLKLGSTRERLEQLRLEGENILLAAKASGIEAASRIEALYGEALEAMRAYQGQDTRGMFDD